MTNTNHPWRDGDDLSPVLKELHDVDPPATLTAEVMSAIANRTRTKTTTPPSIFTMRGRIMAKKVLWIVAAAAAVALIALRLAGYPPVDKGTEATIGAAQRYQAPQISSADVKTGDAQLQAFLQSDIFHQLATDKAAQQALKNKDFQRALADASVRAALASPEIRYAIAEAARNASADAKIGVAANAAAGAKADAVLNSRLDAILQASPALRAALVSPGVADSIASASLGVALSKADVAFALSQDAAVNAVLRAANASLDAAAASPNASPNAAKDAVGNVAR